MSERRDGQVRIERGEGMEGDEVRGGEVGPAERGGEGRALEELNSNERFQIL